MTDKNINIKVSAELAEKYCKAYRMCFPMSSTRRLDDNHLLKKFVEDRLVEEICFLEDEMTLLDPKKGKKASAEKENL